MINLCVPMCMHVPPVMATCKTCLNKVKCLLCFPRQLCCPLAFVKKRASLLPVPRPRVPRCAARGEIREFQRTREGNERSVLLRGHGQKYPGNTGEVREGMFKVLWEATPFLEQIDAKSLDFQK